MTTYSRKGFLGASAGAVAGVGLLGGAGSARAALERASRSSKSQAIALRWTNRWSKGNDTHAAAMRYVLSTFKAKNPGITINSVVTAVGTDVQKNLLDCRAGACPDMMNDVDGRFWDNGYLVDLTPYLKADPKWAAGLDKQALAFTNTGGHQWGLTDELSPFVVLWNTKILEQAGVSSIPKTWNELLVACDKIKRAGKIPTMWGEGYFGGYMIDSLIASQPGGLPALAANRFDAPEIHAAFAAMKTFVDNKWLAANEIEIKFPQAFPAFQNGNVGFYMNGIWTLKNDITSAGVPPDLRNHLAFAALPPLKGTKSVVEKRVATVIGVAATLKKNPAQLAAAVKFLKYFFSQPVAAKWARLSWSPTSVTLPGKDFQRLPALPKAFLKARDEASSQFVLPATPAMKDQLWSHTASAQQALLLGKSVDEAVATYVEYLKKYMKT
jgi:raffinose/stachyose/melibiose transport system substrate-binding protein